MRVHGHGGDAGVAAALRRKASLVVRRGSIGRGPRRAFALTGAVSSQRVTWHVFVTRQGHRPSPEFAHLAMASSGPFTLFQLILKV